MNIATEPHLSGKPIDAKGRTRPVRLVRWFIIVGMMLAIVVGGIVYFQFWKDAFLKNMFATMKPPPATVTVVEVKSEVVPNLLTAVGGLAAGHQVNVTTDVAGRITDILLKPGAHVKAEAPLVKLFDGPEQGYLAIFKAQAVGAQAALDRAKQLASRQFGP